MGLATRRLLLPAAALRHSLPVLPAIGSGPRMRVRGQLAAAPL